MENLEASPLERSLRGSDETSEEEYSSLSTIIQHFAKIPTIDKAWTFKSKSGMTDIIQSPFCILETFHFDDEK